MTDPQMTKEPEQRVDVMDATEYSLAGVALAGMGRTRRMFDYALAIPPELHKEIQKAIEPFIQNAPAFQDKKVRHLSIRGWLDVTAYWTYKRDKEEESAE